MSEAYNNQHIIGRAENVSFPEYNLHAVPARIDTGARTAAIWASDITVDDGVLSCALFDKASPLYTGERLRFATFSQSAVASSNGNVEVRYKVKLLIKLGGR
ncbi:MAG TPA: RimK/LysX family protein, partial [Candidatus Saccharimonadales bacterium]|nr:RimK/LysX family protein [Candidatus Saccharimonadales bacterium]